MAALCDTRLIACCKANECAVEDRGSRLPFQKRKSRRNGG
jgi:hypothetical protein